MIGEPAILYRQGGPSTVKDYTPENIMNSPTVKVTMLPE